MKTKARYLITAILAFLSATVHSQCLCGTASFLLIKKDTAQYNFEIIRGATIFHFLDNNNDTLRYSVSTGGGIDTLIFKVTNTSTKEVMTIITLHMHYDNPYFIDLGFFTSDSFLFDWREIDSLQKKFPRKKLIKYAGKTFKQLNLKDPKSSFAYNEIEILDLNGFLKK